MNLQVALRQATRMGCEVHAVRRTGEVIVYSPVRKPLKINNRRKDSPKALDSILRKLDLLSRSKEACKKEEPARGEK